MERRMKIAVATRTFPKLSETFVLNPIVQMLEQALVIDPDYVPALLERSLKIYMNSRTQFIWLCLVCELVLDRLKTKKVSIGTSICRDGLQTVWSTTQLVHKSF